MSDWSGGYSTDFLDKTRSQTPTPTPLPSFSDGTAGASLFTQFPVAGQSSLSPSPSSSTPILRTLPESVSAFRTKYSDPEFRSQFDRLPPAVKQAATQLDLERVRKGQMPLDREGGLKAALAAVTHNASTPSPDRSASLTQIPGNAVKDLKEITNSLFHIPGMLVNEVRDTLDGFDDNYEESRAAGRNPIQAITDLPLVRLVPGAYTVGNLAGGDADEILKHPLFTALDVLPYASKAAKGSAVFKAADDIALAGIEEGRIVHRPRPLSTVLTKKIDTSDFARETFNFPVVTDNKLGRFLRENVSSTAPVQKLSELMGRSSRDLSRLVEEGRAEVNDLLRGNTRVDLSDPINTVADTTRRIGKVGVSDEHLLSEYGLTRARETELHRVMTETPDDIPSLPANEQRYIADMRTVGDSYRDYMVDHKQGVRLYDGEVYPDKVAGSLERAEQKMLEAAMNVDGGTRILKSGPNKGGERFIPGRKAHWEKLAAADEGFAEALNLWESGDRRAAATKLNRRVNYPFPRVPGITDKNITKLIQTVGAAASREQKWVSLRRASAPARFSPMITARAAASYLDELESRGVLGERGAAERFLSEGRVDGIPGWDWKEFRRQHRDVQGTWEALRAAGEDPIYIPRVSAAQAERATRPGISDTIPTLRSAQERIADFTPSVKSPSIALTHQGSEIVLRHVAERVTREIADGFGIEERVLADRFLDQARELARTDPRLDVFGHQRKLMSDWGVPYDPNTMGVFGGSALKISNNRMWLPRSVGRTLEAMNKSAPTSIARLVDPVTGVMRISLLPLSPRWHLYNIVGGAVMLASEAGVGAFKPSNIRKTMNVLKAAGAGEAVDPTIARELVRGLGYTARDEMTLAFGKGSTARRWFEESQAGRLAKGTIQKLFDFNQHFDDMYRTMGYLYKQDKSLARGMSVKQAQQEGLAVARKVLQDSAALTPFERGVLRSVFPFYSWLSHVMRFALTYPADHPWRAALVGGFGRQVMEDLGSGGTLSMLDSITWGEPDENGNRKGLRVTAMNPFHDAGTMFTLGGWLGALNPIGSTLLNQMGVDAQSGGPELFPTLTYDPETGRLQAVTGNPLQNLLFNTIPQAQVAARAAGFDSDFNALRDTNPGAARSMIASGMGLPILNRASNPHISYMKAETQRQKDRTAKIADLIRAGDLKGLEKLGVDPEKIRVLVAMQQSGQFDPTRNEDLAALTGN